MTAVYVAAGSVAMLAAWLLGSFNGLIASRRGTDEAWADVEALLARRHDLVPGLIAALREHAPGEGTVIETLVQATAEAQAGRSPFGRMRAERALLDALAVVTALGERHPMLAGTAPFVSLPAELHDISDDIQGARRIYNAEVRLYLSRRAAFPANVLAGLGDFPDRPYFELDGTRERLDLRLLPAAAGT